MSETRPGGPWQRGQVREQRSIRWRLRLRPSTARLARRLVQSMCRVWQVPSAADSAALAVSELVGNVERAGGKDVDLGLFWTPRRLRLEVCDTAPGTVVAPSPPAPLQESGRGLWILSHIAVRWGVRTQPVGKCVWAEFAL